MNFRRVLSRLGDIVRIAERNCLLNIIIARKTGACLCHLCGKEIKRPFHADECPDRFYCDSCAACSRYNPDDRCDVCFHRYFGGAL